MTPVPLTVYISRRKNCDTVMNEAQLFIKDIEPFTENG